MRERSEIKRTKWILAIDNLKWRLLGGLVWSPIVRKLRIGKQEIPSL